MKFAPLTPAAQDLFSALVALDGRLEPRKMFGQPAAFLNGNMCLGAFGSDVFLRLSEADRRSAEKIRGAHAFEPMPGRRMREYMVLPGSVLRDPSKRKTWLARSAEYTASLPRKKSRGPR
jgi:TfoX/Sxy family transcriptional regulator of competence genes